MESQSISSILDVVPQLQEKTSNDFLGKEDFFKLLIAQLKYQDPLDPLNDAEFIGQMTEFSELEQLQNMNATLARNAEWDMLLSQTINNTMATSLIGKQVVAETAAVAVREETVSPIVFETTAFAASGTVSIYSTDGSLVRVLVVGDLPAGENSIAWDGKDSDGNRLATGSYAFSVQLFGADGAPVTVESRVTGIVTGVRYIQGQAFLEVDGILLPLADVRRIAMEGS